MRKRSTHIVDQVPEDRSKTCIKAVKSIRRKVTGNAPSLTVAKPVAKQTRSKSAVLPSEKVKLEPEKLLIVPGWTLIAPEMTC
jgi:hypothetical protein